MISKPEVYPHAFKDSQDSQDWILTQNLPEEFSDFPGVFKLENGWRVSKSAARAIGNGLESALAPRRATLEPQTDSGREKSFKRLPEAVTAILRTYQKEAIEFSDRNGAGIVTTMGSGKTLIASASVISNLEEDEKVLIVGPLISRGTWCGEKSDLTKYFGVSCLPLEGRKNVSNEPFKSNRFLFVNFDILNSWQPWISHYLRPSALIIDESQNVKGVKSQRTREIHNISRLSTVKKRLFLTGTPILNRPQELWPQLQAIVPDQFGSYFTFRKRYCALERGPYGWITTGLSNENELRKRLEDVIFYRARHEIMGELPPITRQNVEVDLDVERRAIYDEIWSDVRRWYKKNKLALADGIKSEALVRITKLLQTASLGKVNSTIEIVKSALESHKKVVVFTYFRETTSKIAYALKRHAKIYGPFDGSSDIQKRIKGSEAFAEDTSKNAIFVGTMDATGVSLNALSCASCVVFNDLTWVPAKILQAEKRVHRPGQKSPVNAIYVTAIDTIDGDLFDVLSTKANTVERTIGDNSASDWVSELGSKCEVTSNEIEAFVKALERRFLEEEREG